MHDGEVDAWLVHLAEGVRDGDRRPGDPVLSRAEFETLKAKGLLTDMTVLIHHEEQAVEATMTST